MFGEFEEVGDGLLVELLVLLPVHPQHHPLVELVDLVVLVGLEELLRIHEIGSRLSLARLALGQIEDHLLLRAILGLLGWLPGGDGSSGVNFGDGFEGGLLDLILPVIEVESALLVVAVAPLEEGLMLVTAGDHVDLLLDVGAALCNSSKRG